MIVEERIYTLKPGALPEYRAIYLAEGKDVQIDTLGNLIGYYVTEIGPQNQIVHLWGYDSFEEREARRAKLFQDPKWLSYIEKVKHLVEKQENKILKPLF